MENTSHNTRHSKFRRVEAAPRVLKLGLPEDVRTVEALNMGWLAKLLGADAGEVTSGELGKLLQGAGFDFTGDISNPTTDPVQWAQVKALQGLLDPAKNPNAQPMLEKILKGTGTLTDSNGLNPNAIGSLSKNLTLPFAAAKYSGKYGQFVLSMQELAGKGIDIDKLMGRTIGGIRENIKEPNSTDWAQSPANYIVPKPQITFGDFMTGKIKLGQIEDPVQYIAFDQNEMQASIDEIIGGMTKRYGSDARVLTILNNIRGAAFAVPIGGVAIAAAVAIDADKQLPPSTSGDTNRSINHDDPNDPFHSSPDNQDGGSTHPGQSGSSGQGDNSSGQGDNSSGQGNNSSGQGNNSSGQGNNSSGQGNNSSGQGNNSSGQGNPYGGFGSSDTRPVAPFNDHRPTSHGGYGNGYGPLGMTNNDPSLPPSLDSNGNFVRTPHASALRQRLAKTQEVTTPFGQATPTPFGQATPTPFGQATPTPFGQATSAPFGQANPAPLGQAAPAPLGQAAPAPLGQAAPTPPGQTGNLIASVPDLGDPQSFMDRLMTVIQQSGGSQSSEALEAANQFLSTEYASIKQYVPTMDRLTSLAKENKVA